jgi:hypothetical protein
MMRTELGLDIELCGVFWVSSCDVSQSVNRVKVVDPLFPDQYNCWKMCLKSDSQKFIFFLVLHVFNNSMISCAFPYSCLF